MGLHAGFTEVAWPSGSRATVRLSLARWRSASGRRAAGAGPRVRAAGRTRGRLHRRDGGRYTRRHSSVGTV